jgi:hypothetical protein
VSKLTLCLLCAGRRGTRHCPALETRICPPCCGTKRRRTVSCPDDCPYLTAGREYQEERAGTTKPLREIRALSRDYLHNIEFAILAVQSGRFRDLRDREIAEALENVRKTVETAERKIIYEYKSPDPRIQITTDSINRIIQLHQEGSEGLRKVIPEETKACLVASITAVKSMVRRNPDSTAYLALIRQHSAGHVLKAADVKAGLIDDEILDEDSEPEPTGLIQLP